jgi:hypothetical protein
MLLSTLHKEAPAQEGDDLPLSAARISILGTRAGRPVSYARLFHLGIQAGLRAVQLDHVVGPFYLI